MKDTCEANVKGRYPGFRGVVYVRGLQLDPALDLSGFDNDSDIASGLSGLNGSAAPSANDAPSSGPSSGNRAANGHAGDAGDGKGYSLSQLYDKYAKYLYAYVRAAFRESEPDDIVQQVFVNIAKSHNTEDIANPKAFLRRSAHNVIISRQRRENTFNAYRQAEAVRQHDGPQGHQITPEQIASDREDLQRIVQVLKRMPHKRRQIFIMHRIDGVPCAQIARRLGISPSAAKKHVAKAVRDLDEFMNMSGTSLSDDHADT